MAVIAFMVKWIAGPDDGTHHGLVNQLKWRRLLLQKTGQQANIEQMHFANACGILWHQECRFKTLKTKGMPGFYYNITFGAVVYIQSAGDVDGNHFITTIINMLNELGGQSIGRAVNAR